jgi:hypothetical protein
LDSNPKSKKKDRSTTPIVALLIGCFLSAYGYSRQSALFLWMIPLGLVAAAMLWSYWPRAAATSAPRSGD